MNQLISSFLYISSYNF